MVMRLLVTLDAGTTALPSGVSVTNCGFVLYIAPLGKGTCQLGCDACCVCLVHHQALPSISPVLSCPYVPLYPFAAIHTAVPRCLIDLVGAPVRGVQLVGAGSQLY